VSGNTMRVIVVGLGIQGKKRLAIAGAEAVATVDPGNETAAHRSIRDIPLASYEAALVCTPDAAKLELLEYLLGNGKHVLVEKPLLAEDDAALERLAALARRTSAICYTAYNHRFEPHFVRMKETIESGLLGRIYLCRMFYGNGTARLVRESQWRDTGAGVLPDLGSHLLDTVRFWFGDVGEKVEIVSARCFENRAPDHVVIADIGGTPQLELEMTLLNWRNHFTCDVFAENGSAHIASLCKWGPTSFTVRRRVLPSGRPPEEDVTLVQEDPTWAAEYAHFKQLCTARVATDLSNDRWLNRTLRRLGADAVAQARA
jgi:predicted dehydrogenase